MKSVKELCHFIWRIEYDLALFDRNNTSSFWIMSRMKVYYYLAKKLKILSNPHPHERSKVWFFFYFFNVFSSSLKKYFQDQVSFLS
jgi:hypothetical protein